jgi:hypothetical protein
MKKTIGVILLVGLVSLLWGDLLWASNTGAVPPPTQASQGTVTTPSRVPGGTVPPVIQRLLERNPKLLEQVRRGQFAGRQAVSPAALSGAVFQVEPDLATGVVKITYRLEKPGRVVLTVSDAKGQVVREMVYQDQWAGLYRAVWDGKGGASKFPMGNAVLSPVPSGVYTLKMTTPDGVKTTQFPYSL